jgi:hypothetical protein
MTNNNISNMNIGQIIEDFEPEKDLFYSSISSYFDNPTFSKLKNIENYSMYITKISCNLLLEFKYIIVFVDLDSNPIGFTQNLSNIRWSVLQTRKLNENHNLKSHLYIPRHGGEISTTILQEKSDINSITYNCNKFPSLEIIILFKKPGENIYQPKGNIINALETYNTILTWKNEKI